MTREVKLIEKKEFAAAAFDFEYKVFVVHIATLSVDLANKVHPSKKTQIAYLKADKASIRMLSKYASFAPFFHQN